jgi:hypothetical protein
MFQKSFERVFSKFAQFLGIAFDDDSKFFRCIADRGATTDMALHVVHSWPIASRDFKRVGVRIRIDKEENLLFGTHARLYFGLTPFYPWAAEKKYFAARVHD